MICGIDLFKQITMEKKNGERPITGMFDGCFMVESGLTKREYFAGLFIQGELSGNSKEWANENDLVKRGLLIADELLKQLEQ